MDGQAVSGVPAAGIDQLLYSVEENLPPKAGEEKGRDWGRRVCVCVCGGGLVIVYQSLQIFPDAR